MPRYKDEAKEQVRDAIDFVELVGAKTELRRSGGAQYMGVCPFHEERTGSFSVDASKKVYNCFGCGAGGDVFKFVQETEGVDFVTALELLADRAGITLEVEEEDPRAAERRKTRERLLELMERTATFYVRTLWESPEAAKARDYLAGRGLEEGVLRQFRVGYSPSAWDTVLVMGQRAGFTARELYEVGLVKRARSDGERQGRVYDHFRGRIMFPVADLRGRVLGFGGRSMGEGENRGPKYVNTPASELFEKRKLVYAGDLARSHAAKAGAVVLCEGYTDVIAMHQAGLRNAVATMGTALTEEQVIELGRMAPTVQLALDSDEAGQEAMLKAAKVAEGRKTELRVVPLPEGKDPADVVAAEGGEAMAAMVARSVPFVRFRVERALDSGDAASAEGKDAILTVLRPVFATIPPSVMREELLARVADRLDVAGGLVEQLLRAAPQPRPAPPAERGDGGDPGPEGSNGWGSAPARPEPPAALTRSARAERAYLAVCLGVPQGGRESLAGLDIDEFFSDERARRAAHWVAEHFDDPLDGLPDDDPELARIVREAVHLAGTLEGAELERETLQLEIAAIDRQLAHAPEGRKTELQTLRQAKRLRLNASA